MNKLVYSRDNSNLKVFSKNREISYDLEKSLRNLLDLGYTEDQIINAARCLLSTLALEKGGN